ncbi:poly(R)-hydroxyalkanoic acid synthase subunit [Halobacteriales archaeon QS_4_70_19]|nr:MAG: poly(R)-hydroxyalkanoic acid synthase subunit [Halobacteriales archaeon QS_4_70_19]
MSDSYDFGQQWAEAAEQMNEAMTESMEQNLEAQSAFAESWAEAMEGSVPDQDEMTEGFEGYARAYEVWMDAAEQLMERTEDAAAGEDVSFAELRDIWLQSANEAFKEVMGTSAFAAANGQLVESMMESQQELNEFSEETLEQLGMPTGSQMDEVGKRLVEMERRQHAVEEKLGRVLDHLEDGGE